MFDLPYPNINGESEEKKISQINNYLIRLKDALEFALMSMSSENKAMAEMLSKGLAESNMEREDQITQVSSKISSDSEVTMSTITQVADEIRTEVRTEYELKSDAREIYQGLSSRITQTAEEINLSVDNKITETRGYADDVGENAENNANAHTDDRLKSYSTTTEMNSAISISAESIKSEVNKTIEEVETNLQQQIDGAIETFTGDEVPTLDNAPANAWTTDEMKDSHIKDLYIVSSNGGEYAGFYYRFEKTNGVYQWTLLKDTEITKALEEAREANEKADALAKELVTNYSTTTEMHSAIDQKADEINLSVDKKVTETKTYAETVGANAESNANANTEERLKSYSTTAEMQSAIDMKADSITSTVYKSQDVWIVDEESYSIDIYGYGTPANASAEPDKTYLDMEDGWIYQTILNYEDRYVWTMVGECQKRTDDIYSKIDQNAYGISQKVSNGKVVSEINQSAEEIELKGNRVIIESDKFQLAKDGSATFTSDADIWLMPTASDVDKIMDVALGRITVPDNVFRAMDFNCDGKVNVSDFITAKAILLGKGSVDYYKVAFGYQKQYSKVTIKINPDDAEKPIVISGTNSFGTYIESYFGGTSTSIDQLLAEGANIGKIACGEVETSSGNNLDDIATRLATVETRLGISN